MEISVRNIVIECADDRALATFYAELLGWRIIREDWMVVAKDEHSSPRLAFDAIPGYRPPRWPDHEREYPQQIHMDFDVDDAEAAGERALRLGATRLPDMGGSCPVYADPAGHPFCLCQPGM
jgi:predicted enzyme related to lactoylglutathione lyase